MTDDNNFGKSRALKLRGKLIHKDTNGLISLNDIWTAGGFSKNQRPSDWLRLDSAKAFIVAAMPKITGKSRSFAKSDVKSVWYSKPGPGGGVYAHPLVAMAYAVYLSPALAVEVKDVFLRYKAADPTLADDVLSRAGAEANHWAGVRALGRSERLKFTDTLKSHGVAGPGYGQCTDEVYKALFDARAKQLRSHFNLSKSGALRDAMSSSNLTYIMASESLASERIADEACRGNSECALATSTSAGFIRKALEDDRASRVKKRLL